MYKGLLTAIICILSISVVFATTSNIEAGQQKAQACAACHGPDGNSTIPTYPKIAGQNPKYFTEQMYDFRQGKESGRDNPIMNSIAASLSDQDIADLAAYFASQKTTVGETQEKYLEQGQALYRGGDLKTGIPACSSCHSPDGKGNPEAGFPELSGQNAEYIVAQLNAYKSGQRKNDINNIMGDISAKMSEQQIQAVASYIAGLH